MSLLTYIPFLVLIVSKDLECGPLDDSLTNIHWLGRMSTSSLERHPTKPKAEKENQHVNSLMLQVSLYCLL